MKLPSSGEVLDGKYRIEDKIGEGGFAVVLRATTLTTGRHVALKFLRPSGDRYDTSREARFQREMRVIARLQCPHTLTLFDYGRTADGALYMVSEYVEGEDLLTLLNRRGRLAEREVVWILYQALLSLAEAHELGVLHRDLKPDNLRIFEYAGDPWRLKLLDFGIARPLDTTDSRLTGTGNVVGTPRYMAPEQMLGEELSPATDIYGLGLVGCEMLMGREFTAFDGGGRQMEIPPDADVSPPLRHVINRMVAFAADDRYQTARAVMADLRVLMPGSSSGTVPAEPDPSVPVAGPAEPTVDERDHRGALHFALGAGALLIVAVLATLLHRSQSDDESAPASRRAVSPSLIVPASTRRTTTSAADVGPTRAADAARPVDATEPMTGCGNPPPFEGMDTLREVTGLNKKNRMMYVPRNYDPHRQHPVIVLLREAGQPREHLIVEAGFAELADRENLVLLAPGGGDAGIDIHAVQGKLWDKADDIEDLRRFWRLANAELCLDPTRVFVVGDVSGGTAVERLPCEWPITAMATNGFNAERRFEQCSPREAIPYIQLLHTDDGYNPERGGDNVTNVEKSSWDENAERWRENNDCARKARVVKSEHGECRHYDCNVPYTQCRIDGGRPWPGTAVPIWDRLSGSRGGEPSKFPSVETIWKFFASAPPLDPPEVE